jgi:hypothetical protein
MEARQNEDRELTRRRELVAISDLDAIKPGDPESSHILADEAIERFLAVEHPDIYDAYQAVVGRENGRWWFA